MYILFTDLGVSADDVGLPLAIDVSFFSSETSGGRSEPSTVFGPKVYSLYYPLAVAHGVRYGPEQRMHNLIRHAALR